MPLTKATNRNLCSESGWVYKREIMGLEKEKSQSQALYKAITLCACVCVCVRVCGWCVCVCVWQVSRLVSGLGKIRIKTTSRRLERAISTP